MFVIGFEHLHMIISPRFRLSDWSFSSFQNACFIMWFCRLQLKTTAVSFFKNTSEKEGILQQLSLSLPVYLQTAALRQIFRNGFWTEIIISRRRESHLKLQPLALISEREIKFSSDWCASLSIFKVIWIMYGDFFVTWQIPTCNGGNTHTLPAFNDNFVTITFNCICTVVVCRENYLLDSA